MYEGFIPLHKFQLVESLQKARMKGERAHHVSTPFESFFGEISE